ncbi:MAG TPA: hypothetical protein ENG87_03695 [Candidatus Pacearchaeota archaeon]|nr:hypothetical protein BMS3Abin17_00855 [archaeon BMS3Abin17]HDK42456.1 hypothetical protein [Candidatus Pacearchaeota archaeon]HDZ61338.1 hypothetical protein [Candidatus Pacearchaeota archaeon]
MYIPNDGHKRTIAAMKNNIGRVPILILENTEDISKTIGIESRHYEIIYQNAIEIIREKYFENSEEDLVLSRLKNARIERVY